MKAVERVEHLLQGALEAVDVEIASNTLSPKEQLYRFRLNLEQMLNEVRSNTLPPKPARDRGMGRIIVDSWPLTSETGNAIARAEQAYKDL